MKRLGEHKDKKAILGLFGFLAMTNNTQRSFKIGMEAIKDVSEDAYNFLTKTHSVSDWAASQFKCDHYGMCHCIQLVRESALSVHKETLQGGFTV